MNNLLNAKNLLSKPHQIQYQRILKVRQNIRDIFYQNHMIDIISKKKLIDLLFQSGSLIFPKENGLIPFELKLQILTSQPQILRYAAKLIGSKIKNEKFDLIAGPYSDIPLATTVSLEYNWPMIFVRNERKKYGMEKLIEGKFNFDQKVVIIDEEVGDTASVLQLLGRLEGANLKVVGLFVLIDRELGALEFIKGKGYKCEALITINDIFVHLLEEKKISIQQLNNVKHYFENHRITTY